MNQQPFGSVVTGLNEVQSQQARQDIQCLAQITDRISKVPLQTNSQWAKKQNAKAIRKIARLSNFLKKYHTCAQYGISPKQLRDSQKQQLQSGYQGGQPSYQPNQFTQQQQGGQVNQPFMVGQPENQFASANS